MRVRFSAVAALCLMTVLSMALTLNLAAKDKTPKMSNIQGTVRMMNKGNMTITVAKGNINRDVIYNSDTKWMRGTEASNKPSSLDDLKENWYINCKGTFDGVKLVASACRFRETK